jgi:hypothetical protein
VKSKSWSAEAETAPANESAQAATLKNFEALAVVFVFLT